MSVTPFGAGPVPNNAVNFEKANAAMEKANQKKAEAVKERFDRLESTFIESKGTFTDDARKDDSKVVLGINHLTIQSAATALRASFAPLGALGLAMPQETITGTANLNEDGSVKSLKAKSVKSLGQPPLATPVSATMLGVGPLGLSTTDDLKMTVDEKGNKIYEVTSDDFRGVKRTLVQDTGDRLVLLEDSTHFRSRDEESGSAKK